MTCFSTAILSLCLLTLAACSTKPAVVLPANRTLTCQVPGQKPCERYIIDAGYMREILQRLDACLKG